MKGIAMWALGLVVVAGVAHGASVWIVEDRETFGLRGPGAEFIRDTFGKKVAPVVVANRLTAVSHAVALVAIGLLVWGWSSSTARQKSRNRSAEQSNPFE